MKGTPYIQPDLAFVLYSRMSPFISLDIAQAWSRNPLTTGSWRQLVFVFDGTSLPASNRFKCYFNGQLVALVLHVGFPDHITAPALMNRTIIGAAVGYYGNYLESYFYGAIDDVRIYGRTLLPQEVASLFDIESRPFPQKGHTRTYLCGGSNQD